MSKGTSRIFIQMFEWEKNQAKVQTKRYLQLFEEMTNWLVPVNWQTDSVWPGVKVKRADQSISQATTDDLTVGLSLMSFR